MRVYRRYRGDWSHKYGINSLFGSRVHVRGFFRHFYTLHFLFLIGMGPSTAYKFATLAYVTGFPSLSDHPVIRSNHSPKLKRNAPDYQQYYARLQFRDQGQPEDGGRRYLDRR